jgi:hypothetical protein
MIPVSNFHLFYIRPVLLIYTQAVVRSGLKGWQRSWKRSFRSLKQKLVRLERVGIDLVSREGPCIDFTERYVVFFFLPI